jgi:hypothetical protein
VTERSASRQILANTVVNSAANSIAKACATLLLAILGGCASVSQITPLTTLPTPVIAPLDGAATLLLDEAFRTETRTPNKSTQIELGAAHSAAFTTVFRALIADLSVVEDLPESLANGQIMIRPRLREVQVAAPSETYLNVYEVWLKYSLQFYDDQLQLIDEWFMPAYGKTPDNFMLARSSAIERASDTALRDVGAKLLIDFQRIPSLAQWRSDSAAALAP